MFTELSDLKIAEKTHEKFIEEYLSDTLFLYNASDATAIDLRQKAVKKDKKSFQLTIRNHSGIKAIDVEAKVRFPAQKMVVAKGPSEVEPYGVAEYTLESAEPVIVGSWQGINYKVRCKNCQALISR